MVKQALVERAGLESSWKVCPTTDGASNVVSSRSISRHGFVGLTVVYENNCVDHTMHLIIEGAIDGVTIAPMAASIGKVRAMVNYLKQNSLAMQFLLQLEEELEMVVIIPCQETSNR